MNLERNTKKDQVMTLAKALHAVSSGCAEFGGGRHIGTGNHVKCECAGNPDACKVPTIKTVSVSSIDGTAYTAKQVEILFVPKVDSDITKGVGIIVATVEAVKKWTSKLFKK